MFQILPRKSLLLARLTFTTFFINLALSSFARLIVDLLLLHAHAPTLYFSLFSSAPLFAVALLPGSKSERAIRRNTLKINCFSSTWQTMMRGRRKFEQRSDSGIV